MASEDLLDERGGERRCSYDMAVGFAMAMGFDVAMRQSWQRGRFTLDVPSS